MSVAASATTTDKPHRPRRERLMRYPRAHSYEASRPIEECHLQGRMLWGWRGKACAAVRANVHRLRGVAFTPVGWERLAIYLQALFADAFGSKRNGQWVLMVGRPNQEDRRERPQGITDVEMSATMQMNYYRPLDARAALKKKGYLIARQPREWNIEEDRWQGEANQIELTWRLLDELGIVRAEVEAGLEEDEAARLAEKKAQAQLEGQQRAADQQDARNRRGEDFPLTQAKRPARKAAAAVLDLPVDADGRRVPHTDQERKRFIQISFELGQDPELRARPELLKATALARWREELGPPT